MTFRNSPVYVGLSATVCMAVLFSAAPVLTQTTRSFNAVVSLGAATSAVETLNNTDERLTHPFTREWLVDHARELATQPYVPTTIDANGPLGKLDYDGYRRITFQPSAAIWARENRNFSLDLFHPGFIYNTPVNINLVVDGVSRRVLYDTDIFRYDDEVAEAQNVEAPGYSGFRVYHPINSAQRYEEFLVFQGASYLRATAKDQMYGLSARGLAINTARPEGEEFPMFTDFWIERPDVDSEHVVVHALLNSDSTTGAYTFTVQPGDSTVIDVDASLFPRRDIEHYGVAPLTSMFLFDATNRSRFDDFRSAVHDSDGLHMHLSNGEQVWRPLANPQRLQATSIKASSPQGFGLMQRHSEFAHFNDSEARYEERTSLWIEPLEDFGEGHITLIEIPTRQEVHDNIVAFWQPAEPLRADQRHDFRYRMHWGPDTPHAVSEGLIVETGRGAALNHEGDQVFVIDYTAGDKIPNILSNPEAVEIRAATSAGVITDASGGLVESNGNYRAYIRMDPQRADLAELRVTLHLDDEQWGETWIYRWSR